MSQLDRIVFATSRAAEFLDRRALQAQTGRRADEFGDVVMKELVDNALDAAETAGAWPEITLELDSTDDGQVVIVTDNGPGIAADVVKRILDFDVLVSDKAAYRAPTRGMQGNAWKTVLGIPYSLGVFAPVVVEAQGIRHEIAVASDPGGNVEVKHQHADSDRTTGTRVCVPLRADLEIDVQSWARAFAAVNPHAEILWRGPSYRDNDGSAGGFVSYKRTVGEGWRKPVPTDRTSPHWYDPAALRRQVFAFIAVARNGGTDLALGEFIRTFDSLSSTRKAKAVAAEVPGIRRLSDFEQDPNQVDVLLAAMKQQAREVKPGKLGAVGEDHMRSCLEEWFGVSRLWYKSVRILQDGMPWVLEVAVAETERPGDVFYAANYSPTFADPLGSLHLDAGEFSTTGAASFLRRCDAFPSHENDQLRAAIVHVICPGLEFTDKGKTHIGAPAGIAHDFAKAFKSVGKVLRKEKKRRERDALAADRQRSRSWERVTQREAVFEALPQAIAEASGGGIYNVPARNLYYQIRPLIQDDIDGELSWGYFSQTLLTAYQKEYGPITGLVRDPRGNLHEPHTGKVVPLGTVEVEDYVLPDNVFDKILYVEKEGLTQIFQTAHLGERYDMAIAAGKGQPVEAVRNLFARAERGNYRLFVLHDADPSGYVIARAIAKETRRMPDHNIEVIDLGLSVADAIAHGLQTEEFTRKIGLPRWMSGQLDGQEKEWFEGERHPWQKQWRCRRVELNALTAPDLVAFVEAGLARHGAAKKLLPPAKVIAKSAKDQLRQTVRELVADDVHEALDLESIVEALISETAGLANVKRKDLQRLLKDNPPNPWRAFVADQIRDGLDAESDELKRKVQAILIERLADLQGGSS